LGNVVCSLAPIKINLQNSKIRVARVKEMAYILAKFSTQPKKGKRI